MKHMLEVFVVDSDVPPVIGKTGIDLLRLIQRVNTLNSGDLISVFSDVFQDGPGLIPGKYPVK
mgnify:CR=1 FL=1